MSLFKTKMATTFIEAFVSNTADVIALLIKHHVNTVSHEGDIALKLMNA